MNPLLWIVFGGITGWVASVMIGVHEGIGVMGNMSVGIAGAFIGGKLASIATVGLLEDVEHPAALVNLLWAIASANVLLLLANIVF